MKPPFLRFLPAAALLAILPACRQTDTYKAPEFATATPAMLTADPAPSTSGKIQVALLLDTSNSMDGLIEQAKSKLWDLVNELAHAERDGIAPEIDIALYEYGNDRLDKDKMWIRQVTPFTHDLDDVSQKLFALHTLGGQEYCGAVIQDALAGLTWSDSQSDYRTIFIAGNEPFTQGPVGYNNVVSNACKRGVIVNTIFCGDREEGIRTGWKDGADSGCGEYMNINSDAREVYIATPFDGRLEELNDQMNKTYIWYGHEGQDKWNRQTQEDENAKGYGSSNMATRATTKANAVYKNDDWDMVDYYKTNKGDLSSLKSEEMPEEMKKMTPAERDAYIAGMVKSREAIQAEINALDKQRREYIREKEATMDESLPNTLGKAMKESVKRQAEQKAFQIK